MNKSTEVLPTMTAAEEAAWVEMARTGKLRDYLRFEGDDQGAYQRELARRAGGV